MFNQTILRKVEKKFGKGSKEVKAMLAFDPANSEVLDRAYHWMAIKDYFKIIVAKDFSVFCIGDAEGKKGSKFTSFSYGIVISDPMDSLIDYECPECGDVQSLEPDAGRRVCECGEELDCDVMNGRFSEEILNAI